MSFAERKGGRKSRVKGKEKMPKVCRRLILTRMRVGGAGGGTSKLGAMTCVHYIWIREGEGDAWGWT